METQNENKMKKQYENPLRKINTTHKYEQSIRNVIVIMKQYEINTKNNTTNQYEK